MDATRAKPDVSTVRVTGSVDKTTPPHPVPVPVPVRDGEGRGRGRGSSSSRLEGKRAEKGGGEGREEGSGEGEGRCESFRVFVMCLHGLDILSMWVLFFSLLCATATVFQRPRLAKGVEVSFHELYGQSTVVFCRSGRDAFFKKTIVCILCADHVFWYSWLLQ